MKYIKKEMPAAYKKWFDENNLRLQNSELDENEMFNKITAKLKRILERHLLKEQGHICAYCGKRIGHISTIGEFLTFSVDHFEAQFCNRDLILAYSNLLGTCKMSQYKSNRVDLASIKSTPKTFKNIALELGIDIEDFTGKGWIKKEDDLIALNISEVKYREISLHCDDGKEERLKKIGWVGKIESAEKYIINPTKDMDCETYFKYLTDETGIFCDIKEIENMTNTQKAKNTIEVFELNTEYLRKKRTDAVEKAKKLRNDMEKFNLENEDILEEIYAKDAEGKLTPYCFVIASVFRTFL